MRFKKSQSIFEYICLTVVFATVGLAAFFATNRGSTLARRGTMTDYTGTNTLIGKTIATGYEDQQQWPGSGAMAGAEGSWYKEQEMPLAALDSKELDGVEADFYARDGHNRSTPINGMQEAAEYTSPGWESGEENAWTNVSTHRSKWHNEPEVRNTKQHLEATSEIDQKTVERLKQSIPAKWIIANQDRIDSPDDFPVNLMAYDGGEEGHTDTWLYSDANWPGYKPEWLQEHEEE